MNDFQDNVSSTPERALSQRYIEGVRQQGGIFVDAVRLTRMPMLVTDAMLPGNPIVFANKAFIDLSGYSVSEIVGQDPHFMNGKDTDPEAIERYEQAIEANRDETLEILQYRKDGSSFHAMLFASPLGDGQGTITNHFLSYLNITRRYEAEEDLRVLTAELEARVAERTKELELANRTLKGLIDERDRLLAEVNHRAKNSLAIAAALLGVQARRQESPTVRVLFEEAQDRLNAMARVHDLLSRSETSQRVEVAAYVRDLCDALRPITGDDHRISLEARAEQGILVEADTAVPLGIILTELVTNAVKYAFPAPNAGTITIRVHRVPGDRVEVQVEDDGVGMLDIREGSLGFGLVRALVKQIGGEMDVRSSPGATIRVDFPAPGLGS